MSEQKKMSNEPKAVSLVLMKLTEVIVSKRNEPTYDPKCKETK